MKVEKIILVTTVFMLPCGLQAPLTLETLKKNQLFFRRRPRDQNFVIIKNKKYKIIGKDGTIIAQGKLPLISKKNDSN